MYIEEIVYEATTNVINKLQFRRNCPLVSVELKLTAKRAQTIYIRIFKNLSSNQAFDCPFVHQ